MAGSYPSPKGIHPFLLLALVVGCVCVCGWGGGELFINQHLPRIAGKVRASPG